MMFGFGYIREYRARGKGIKELKRQRRRAMEYCEGMEEKVKHLRRKFHRSDNFARALKGKIAKYEQATEEARAALQGTDFNYLAVILKQAYDAPIRS